MDDGFDNLAVHIELQLITRSVSGSNWQGIHVTIKVRKLDFLWHTVAINVVNNSKLGASEARGVQQPTDERVAFLFVAQSKQCSSRECRISQPTIAIVPVAVAAELFGQRRSWRGDNRAGRSE